MKVSDGLVGIADSRITTGSEVITARKVSVHRHGGRPMFLMTSGLRSLRDKTLTYFEEQLESGEASYDRLYKAANAFADQMRRVAREDKDALSDGRLFFDLHVLIGGQFEHDKEHKLYMLYPQGNWVEMSQGTPYYILGESSYGKPILDRTLKHTDCVRFALKVGCLAFDSTRISSTTVGFPLDVVVYLSETREMIEHRFEKEELEEMLSWWQQRMRASVGELPSGWMSAVLTQIDSPTALPATGSQGENGHVPQAQPKAWGALP